ncbi:MAG: hypothetical protein E7355_00925 [Clostridiales bacterium]|nr:hypothetical protein [Clostridiales bacterium]
MEEKKQGKFTAEQLRAIETDGKTIVSASAGSGKTTVMIEKIIRFIRSGGRVNEILAVTFTKKAASQMKEKLRKALVSAINEPNVSANRRAELKQQLDEVSTADISTIHSFCARLIRTHFYKAGVDNAFRVIGSDDADGTALKNEAIDDVFEQGYAEKDEAFTHLLSVYWRKKSDNTLRKNLLSVYDKLRNRADYRFFLENAGDYDETLFNQISADLLAFVKEKAAYYLERVEEERAYFETIQSPPQLALCTELGKALEAIINAETYFSACALQKPVFPKKSSSKKDSPEKKAHIERLADLKDKTAKIYDDEFSKTASKEEELNALIRSGKTACAIAKLLLAFDEKYTELKREHGVLDYNDLEHISLNLLTDEEIRKELREKYRYVFVDEYQDVNPVQEELISRIGGENLFLVGDVKQSIYGFRGSNSRFFVEKQRLFANGEGESLYMSSNFRSCDAVLDAVNTQFSLAMTPRTSSVDYARDSYMNRGGRYALGDGRVQIHLLAKEEKEAKSARGVYSVKANAKRKEEEDSSLAKTIRHIIDWERTQKWYDADKEEYVPVRYSDIAVLARKKNGGIGKTVAALAAEGIPITASSAVNICDFSEIKTLIDILSLIDNSRQDIPLCSALLSTMGNLTADDLAQIRLAYPEERYFRNACLRYANEREEELSHRLRRFYQYLRELRVLACVMNAGEIITKILTDTSMEARLLTRENGAASIRRIHRFIEETNDTEPLSVHAFLLRLRDLEYCIEYSENGGEDSVKVLTMHSSKGLEYPVVIIDDLNVLFHGADHDEFLIDEKYGIAPRAFDEEKMTKRGTLLRRLCENKQEKNSVADELNLYYVALTRAKYGLHLLCSKPSVAQDVCYARSFADFTDFSVWDKYLVTDEIFDVPKADRQAFAFRPNEALAQKIIKAFTWQYTHKGCENLSVKSSATQLMDDGDYTAETAEERVLEIIEEDGGKTGVEAGIAYHAFLENFDFALLFNERGEPISKEELVGVVEKALQLFKEKRLPIETEYLSADSLVNILSNPVFYRLAGKRLYKERQFLVALPISDTYARKKSADKELLSLDNEEEMIFQGAIDLLAIDDDGAWIIDYKYSKKDAEALKERYALQLDLYRQATAKILKMPMEKIRCSIVNIYKGFQVDFD